MCSLCLFVAGVLSEMHKVRTFAPCKALIFYLTPLLFFRRLKKKGRNQLPYIFEGLIFGGEGLIYGGKLAFQNRLG